jgi:hypothetical protein
MSDLKVRPPKEFGERSRLGWGRFCFVSCA